MELLFRGIDTAQVEAFRAGEPDANGQRPLLQPGAGLGPCRHCLGMMSVAEPKLILAYRPFATRHPYSEVGPIFLHPSPCPRYEAPQPPAWFEYLDPAIVRGYGRDDWIRYDTGKAIVGKDVACAVRSVLADETVAYVHVRSQFGCLQCRVDRAWPTPPGFTVRP
jgi:hypothetical protein